MGLVWVKNVNKCYFHASHLTRIPLFPEGKILKIYSLLKKVDDVKDELTDDMKHCKSLLSCETNCKLILKENSLLKFLPRCMRNVEPSFGKNLQSL